MGAKHLSSPLETAFGPLESRVLEALWARETAASVRDLQPQFPQVAYTTLMTTLDRLYRKGALMRHKAGRARPGKERAGQHGCTRRPHGESVPQSPRAERSRRGTSATMDTRPSRVSWTSTRPWR